MNLPVIIGCGGVGPAGRSSFNHAFNWIVYEALSEQEKRDTLASLVGLTKTNIKDKDKSLDEISVADMNPEELARLASEFKKSSFIRKLDKRNSIFQNHPIRISGKQSVDLVGSTKSGSEALKSYQNPENEKKRSVEVDENSNLYLSAQRGLKINAGGQLPIGCEPGELYKSTHHPRGLQLSVYGVSDALYSVGIDWQKLTKNLSIDQVGVYASSMLGNVDEYGAGGYLQAAGKGLRASSKQLALSMPQMSADFINSYVLGHLGHTQATIGACATFLYNLYSAVTDIQSGKRKLALVGVADAPLMPEVIEAYAAMGALATDSGLVKLDSLKAGSEPDYARSCRPFADNCGFVLGESAQFFVLCSDDLALDVGANILGSVGGVYVNADGYKKSISKPGAGNLFSLIKACSLARAMIGEDALRKETFVSAHGTGTPQNRVTESAVLSQVADLFSIDNWPVCAVKNYVGHSTGPAAGDQLSFMLGSFAQGIIPGISNSLQLADDVSVAGLNFCLNHQQVKKSQLSGGFINAKGFGGNNATAFILSPNQTLELIKQRYGQKKVTNFLNKQESSLKEAKKNDTLITTGRLKPIYNTNLFIEEELKKARLNGDFVVWNNKRMKLDVTNPYLKI
ncbi:MAG: beta-ketoacyl synthase [SAR324 cluster bacterium]|nr:beta-ketoacyl synthase [SAR324 cluster bacterium]